MNLYEKIQELSKQKKMSIRQVEEKLNYGNGTIRRWNKQTPGIDKILNIANFFNVSTDYLLGLSETKERNNTIDNLEYGKILHELMTSTDNNYLELFIKFSKLDKDELQAVENLVDTMINKKSLD